MSFVDEFAELLNDILLATPVALDGYGDWVASGTVLSIPCRIEGGTITTRDDETGNEVVSHVQVICGGFNNLTTRDHRYTLPARYAPRLDLRAVHIEKVTDEDGPCYESVFLP